MVYFYTDIYGQGHVKTQEKKIFSILKKKKEKKNGNNVLYHWIYWVKAHQSSINGASQG